MTRLDRQARNQPWDLRAGGILKDARAGGVVAELGFQVGDCELGVRSLTATIDGRSLADMIADYEARRGFDAPGGYGGLIPSFFDYGPLERYFHNNPPEGLPLWVLGCGGCGEVGCAPIECRIVVGEASVVWQDFGGRGESYPDFGPFVFERAQYDAAVRAMAVQF